jgi:hypothetical protein
MNTTNIEETKTVNKTPKNILDSVNKYQKNNKDKVNEKMRRYYERVKADPEKHAKMKERQKLWRDKKKQLKNENENIEQ